jgi:anti-sigma-K factor RskA
MGPKVETVAEDQTLEQANQGRMAGRGRWLAVAALAAVAVVAIYICRLASAARSQK